MVAAGQSVGLTVIVRVADPDPTLIAIAIDAKADGVLVPYCEDAEMIKRCAWKTALHPLKGKAFEDVLNSEKFPSKKTKDYLNKRNGHSKLIPSSHPYRHPETVILQTKLLDLMQ